MADYKFYMQRVDIVSQPIKDLEKDFPGLKYKEFKGLESYGKNRGVYTEVFPETDEVQVYMTPSPIRDSINLTFTAVFVGSDWRDTYHSFVDFISSGIIKYWDTCRKREITFVLVDAIEPSEDYLYGVKYIQASFNLKAINGQAKTLTI